MIDEIFPLSEPMGSSNRMMWTFIADLIVCQTLREENYTMDNFEELLKKYSKSLKTNSDGKENPR